MKNTTHPDRLRSINCVPKRKEPDHPPPQSKTKNNCLTKMVRNPRDMHVLKFDDSRMRSEGFSFNSGGRGVVFAQRCFHDRNRPQPSAGVRNEGAISLTIVGRAHKMWQNVLRMTCSRPISTQIAWFCWVLRHALRLRLRFAWQAQSADPLEP